MTELVIIAAVSDNNVIGKDNALPWSIPEDLKRFRKLTMYCPVIMGRKTYESIIKHLGEPLDKRINNVLTTRRNYKARKGVEIFNSLDDVIVKNWPYRKCYVIGGESVYKEALPFTKYLELTRVHQEVEGDAFFPEVDYRDWSLTNSEPKKGCTFESYERLER